jgi:hypothetical protein
MELKVGDKCHMLTVLDVDTRVERYQRKNNKVQNNYFIKVKCDCGNTNEIRKNHFGKTKSCGCITKVSLKKGDKKFRLTFLKVVVSKSVGKKYRRFIEVECDCGKKKEIRIDNFGKHKSCGCYEGQRLNKPKGEAAFTSLFCNYKANAKKRNLSFNLTKDEFRKLTKGNCHYCGDKPKHLYKKQKCNGAYKGNGVDRLNNKLGYTINNCVSCCYKCNWMKSDLTPKKFLKHIEKIYSRIEEIKT